MCWWDALSSVIEYRSLESGQHIKRIRLLTQVLLEEVCRNCPEYGLDKKKIEVIARPRPFTISARLPLRIRYLINRAASLRKSLKS